MDRISLNKVPIPYEVKYPVLSGNGTQPVAKPEGFIIPSGDRLGELESLYGSKKLKSLGLIPCEKCSSRTYIDGSDDPGVSFKTPTKISPEASFAAVSAHEGEHVSNEKANAHAEDREVVSQSVRIFMSICSECGKSYASGGVTTTQTANKPKYKEGATVESGALVDVKV